MINSVLLMAWPHQGEVLTSFRMATDYFMPDLYNGTASLTQLSSHVNETGYEVVYHCQNCLTPEDGDGVYAVKTSQGSLVLGYAQSFDGPTNAACPGKIAFTFHNNGYGQWGTPLDGIVSRSYAELAGTKAKVVTGDCTS